MKRIMFFAVSLIVGCQESPSTQRPQYVRLLPSIKFQGAGFSEFAGLLSEKDGYEFFLKLYSGDTNALNRFLSDVFIANSCYELHFEWHVATSDLVHYFTREIADAGWKVKKREKFIWEEFLSGPNWIRVYEKKDMKIHVHLSSLSSDDPEEYEHDDIFIIKGITFGFFNCEPGDVFDPAELFHFTNGVSSTEFNQIRGGYRKPGIRKE